MYSLRFQSLKDQGRGLDSDIDSSGLPQLCLVSRGGSPRISGSVASSHGALGPLARDKENQATSGARTALNGLKVVEKLGLSADVIATIQGARAVSTMSS